MTDLLDALLRGRRVTTEAGGIGLFVDAIDERAADFTSSLLA